LDLEVSKENEENEGSKAQPGWLGPKVRLDLEVNEENEGSKAQLG
jgi:hypothetical protein